MFLKNQLVLTLNFRLQTSVNIFACVFILFFLQKCCPLFFVTDNEFYYYELIMVLSE